MSTPPVEARLADLERQIGALSGELAKLRAELHHGAERGSVPSQRERRAESAPAELAAMASYTARPSRSRRPAISGQDVERYLGRYGMLVLAVLAAVAAVGTFLSWAITRGYLVLGPAARVGVGLVVAVAIGVWGLRLRRTERSFGSSLLGLALVIMLVCAYAAGPSFQLVPSWVAFTGAAAVSWVLAVFAHAENDEPLWCVGFGGAAFAPFVTSDGHGNVYALTAYATILLVAACFALNHRTWPVARRIFYGASALLVLAGAMAAPSYGMPGFLAAFGVPFAVAAAGVLPFSSPAHKRASLRWLGVLALVASLANPATIRSGWTVAAVAYLSATILWLAVLDANADVAQSSILVRDAEREPMFDWFDAALLPLLFSVQTLQAAGHLMEQAPVYATLAVLCAVFAVRRVVGALRDAAALAAAVLAVGAVFEWQALSTTLLTASFVALSLVFLELHRLRPTLSWLGAGLGLMITAATLSANALGIRVAYQFTPFGTTESATALVVLAGLVLLARFWRALRVATRASLGHRPEWTYADEARLLVQSTTLAPWLWAFVWVLIELSMTYSPSTSTLLLVTYFAVTAVGCVAVGRARRKPRIRQTGLALGIAATGTAFYGASTYFDFAARIAAYLVTSAFLLGIAYWYRRPGASATAV